MKVMINFDIRDERPYKSVRVYDINGNALGFGDKILNKTRNESTLFSEEDDFVTYLVDLNDDVLKSLVLGRPVRTAPKPILVEKIIEEVKVEKVIKETPEPEVKDPIVEKVSKEILWGMEQKEDNWVEETVKKKTEEVHKRMDTKGEKLNLEDLL